jgi:hypothetical protein
VLSHVRFQVVFQVEPTPADIAHESTFLCVRLDVPLEFGPGFEGEIAASALELKKRGR